jgi:hypothetical protein
MLELKSNFRALRAKTMRKRLSADGDLIEPDAHQLGPLLSTAASYTEPPLLDIVKTYNRWRLAWVQRPLVGSRVSSMGSRIVPLFKPIRYF